MDTAITPNYLFLLKGKNVSPISNARLWLTAEDGATVWTGSADDQGEASFDIVFNHDNYQDTWVLTASKDDWSDKKNVALFTSSPIVFSVSSDGLGDT